MTAEGHEESYAVLAEQRLGRQGFHVKLDRGFKDGTYCCYVEFDDLAGRVGFNGARREAWEYAKLLKAELAHVSGHCLGETEDASRSEDPRRKRDLELTYLTFPLLTTDGRFHDEAMKEGFGLAMLRASQQWDQRQARVDTRRRASRQDAFRLRLGGLLASDSFQHLDEATKTRLLDAIPPLAFPSRGIEL